MICHDQRDATAIMNSAAQTGNARIAAEQIHCRDLAQGEEGEGGLAREEDVLAGDEAVGEGCCVGNARSRGGTREDGEETRGKRRVGRARKGQTEAPTRSRERGTRNLFFRRRRVKPSSMRTLLTERLVDVDGCGVGERPDLRVGHARLEERRDGEAGPGGKLRGIDIFRRWVRW